MAVAFDQVGIAQDGIDPVGVYIAPGDDAARQPRPCVSCIAVGADSIFAEIVLDLGGELQVILPAADYRDRKVKPEHAGRFDT